MELEEDFSRQKTEIITCFQDGHRCIDFTSLMGEEKDSEDSSGSVALEVTIHNFKELISDSSL